MFYIGNQNKLLQKWNSRFSGPFEIVDIVGQSAKLKHTKIELIIPNAALSYLKQYVEGDEWRHEENYDKFIKDKQKYLNRNKKNVKFDKNKKLVKCNV